ncbi:MAG TPA: cyclic nucleotide-binding domain-containing protein [Candidatus Eisenbacteria bacterium]|nr:cyclic nucleotide-binding domain-containing protein [Candidatus Eisenbacteria bacterium]
MGRASVAIRSALAASRDALANPAIRRVQIAWLAGIAADTAITVTITVLVFQASGPVGVAVLGAARTLPATVSAFFAALPLSHWRPDRLLVGLSIIRGLSAVAMSVVIWTGADQAWLFGIVGVLGVCMTMVRPAHNTILPALARTPAELIAANVSTSTGEAIGTFLGPAAAAVLIATGMPLTVGPVAVLFLLIGVLALAGVRFESVEDQRGPRRGVAGDRPGSRLGRRVLAGFRAAWGRPTTGLVLLGFGLQTGVRGLLATLIVVASVDLLAMGQPGVGVLNSAIGVGGFFGLFAALVLGRSSPRGFSIALAAWGLPIALIGLVPVPAVAVVALGAVGLSNAVLDIVGFTLLQRGCRNEERGPIFAVLEVAAGIGMTIGSLAAPVLIFALGTRGALIATGAILPLAAVVLAWLLDRVGHAEIVPASAIESLKRVPAFRPLPLTSLERLAEGLTPFRFAAQAVLMRKGDYGDRFLLIESGSVEVSDEGRRLQVLGPGSGIGEIALLHGGLRTATVTALTDVEGFAVDALTFQTAVAGPAASAAAAEMAEARLARSRSAE